MRLELLPGIEQMKHARRYTPVILLFTFGLFTEKQQAAEPLGRLLALLVYLKPTALTERGPPVGR